MKQIFQSTVALMLIVAASSALLCQSKIVGNWEGQLDIGSRKFKMILHIKADSAAYKSFMDSPEQGAVNMALEQTQIAGDSLFINDPNRSRISLKGLYIASKDSVSALFEQYGLKIPIVLGRSGVSGFTLNRPQTPKPPFPYTSEDVVFTNAKAKNIKLAGTLTKPPGKIRCAAILISGSGPQGRNEKAFDHEPFLILSDFLSRNGVAVLRYDDRGVAQSEGNFAPATSYDFSTDAEAALDFLKKRDDIPSKKIGLIGHSEGGMIAPMVAARRKDVAFVISLAGVGVPLDQVLMKQLEAFSRFNKESDSTRQQGLKMNAEVFACVKDIDQPDVLESKIRSILKAYNYMNGDTSAHRQFIRQVSTPWLKYAFRYDPADALPHVKCPFLALNGTLDKQVDAAMNLEAMRAGLKKGRNPDFTMQYLPGLNHGFQEAKTGDFAEYRMIEQTVSPIALEAINTWIHKRF